MKRIKLPDWMLMTLLMVSAIGALPKVQAAEQMSATAPEVRVFIPNQL